MISQHHSTTSGVDTDPTQSITSLVPASDFAIGHLHSRPISDTESDSQLIQYNLTLSQHSTPPTPRRENYPFILDSTLIRNPQEDPRYLFYALHKLETHPTITQTRRDKEIARLHQDNLTIKFEITVEFLQLNPHPIHAYSRVNTITTPSPFITTDLRISTLDIEPFDRVEGFVEFLNPYSRLKYRCSF